MSKPVRILQVAGWDKSKLRIFLFFLVKLTWMFPTIGVPQNGWFIMETPIKMDDLGIPLFSETATSSQVLLT